MRIRWTTRIVMATGVLTLIAGVATGGGPAHAATTGYGSAPAAPQAPSYVTDGQLNGVAATAPGNAWAVGYTGTFGRTKALILHWNGKSWS
jgi:hypothetical protein